MSSYTFHFSSDPERIGIPQLRGYSCQKKNYSKQLTTDSSLAFRPRVLDILGGGGGGIPLFPDIPAGTSGPKNKVEATAVGLLLLLLFPFLNNESPALVSGGREMRRCFCCCCK